MKKYILLLINVFLVCSFTDAQYRINKTKYDYHTYTYQVGDPYNPAVAGITSLLIPGLGQMFSGENGRGLAFLGGDLVCTIIYVIGGGMTYNETTDETAEGNPGLIVVGGLGMIIVEIWSIVDAVHVAKVNNLAFRDKNKTSFRLQAQPYFSSINSYAASKPVAGISIQFIF